MNKIRLIIWREFITRVRKPSFLIMTILGPLLIAGGIFTAIYLGMQDSTEHRVLVIERTPVIVPDFKDTENLKFVVDAHDWDDSAFKASDFTVMVRLNEEVSALAADIYYKDLPNLRVQTAIQNELQKANERFKLLQANVPDSVYVKLRQQLPMRWLDIDKAGEESLEQERAGIGFFFGYFMFIFIFLYGVQVMRGVMEEKQNRVVEVLISSVKPFQLMMGKIVGIALVGFVQFILWIVLTGALTGIGTALLIDDKFDPKELANTPMTPQVQQQLGMQLASMDDAEGPKLLQAAAMIDLPLVLCVFVIYFIGGYLLYSSLLAAIGSAVDSETETQQFMLPVTIPMIIAIAIAQIAVYNPESPAVLWCSFIPFTSPVVMMVRVAMGNAPGWQLALSVALLIGTFILTTWLAGRIYRTGILMYGKRTSWKEIMKWLFYKG